jgi:hypothetical protein
VGHGVLPGSAQSSARRKKQSSHVIPARFFILASGHYRDPNRHVKSADAEVFAISAKKNHVVVEEDN